MWRKEQDTMECSCGAKTDYDYSYFFAPKEQAEYGVLCKACFDPMVKYILKRPEVKVAVVADPNTTQGKRILALQKARAVRSARAKENAEYELKMQFQLKERLKGAEVAPTV